MGAGRHSPDAVFVTDGWVNSLTDAAGRRRLTTFGPYVANLGYRPDERIGDVVTIYCGGDAAVSASLMRRSGATHVVDGSHSRVGRPWTSRSRTSSSSTDFAASGSLSLPVAVNRPLGESLPPHLGD